jgi:hypothetical protein
MATHVRAASASSALTAWRRQAVLVGALSGIVGGVVFGLMMSMAMPPMMGMIGSLVGAPGLGWVVHLVFSAIIGAGFGLVFGRRAAAAWGRAAGLGLGYGAIWWMLGPLLIMPIWMGMGPMLARAFEVPNLLSLMGHLVYGLVTALVYRAVTR